MEAHGRVFKESRPRPEMSAATKHGRGRTVLCTVGSTRRDSVLVLDIDYDLAAGGPFPGNAKNFLFRAVLPPG